MEKGRANSAVPHPFQLNHGCGSGRAQYSPYNGYVARHFGCAANIQWGSPEVGEAWAPYFGPPG